MAMHMAAQAKENASIATAQAAPTMKMTIPARALPIREATCPAEDDRPEAVAIRSRPTISGIIEKRAGERKVFNVLMRNTVTKIRAGAAMPLARMTAATIPTTRADTALVMTIMYFRSQRSATAPAKGPNTMLEICQITLINAV